MTAAPSLQQNLQEPGIFQALLPHLKACSKTRNLTRGRQLHAEATVHGHSSNIYLANVLIHMYARCGSMLEARQMFESVSRPTLVSWNSLLLGYADNGQALTALEMFNRMRSVGTAPSSVTFLAVLKACASLVAKGECSSRVKTIHCLAIDNGCGSSVYVQSSLIDLYAKCGSMADSRRLFNSLENPDVVSWSALILGYADNGEGLNALDSFTRMRSADAAPNPITFLAALRACISLAVNGGPNRLAECREWGKEIHVLAVESGCIDLYVQSTLMDLHSKCGSMLEARQVFDSMKFPDVVSWTSLIQGYAENGQALTALDLFTKMRSRGPAPSSVTFLAVLKACGMVGGLEFGRTVHQEIDRAVDRHMIRDMVLVTCLVDFYARCGSLVEARSIFDSHSEARDKITWTTLLAGFSMCGDQESVFELFQGMQDSGLVPDAVTLLCVLTCCNHAGLVEKGKECFDAMLTKYGLAPTVEHFTCVIDLFGRSKQLDDAMALLKCMPCDADAVTWTTVLGACCKWKNVEVGRLAFQSLVYSNRKDGVAYVLMGQIYGIKGMLQERDMVMGMRKKLNAWEKPGETCWTSGLGEVHTFLVDDNLETALPHTGDLSPFSACPRSSSFLAF